MSVPVPSGANPIVEYANLPRRRVRLMLDNVLRSYPAWHTWSIRQQAAIAMLEHYADTDSALAGEGIEEGERSESFLSAVDAFYANGHHPVYRTVNRHRPVREDAPTARQSRGSALAGHEIMMVVMHRRLLTSARALALGEGTASDERMLRNFGFYDAYRRDGMSRSSGSKGGGARSQGSQRSKGESDVRPVDEELVERQRMAWPDTKGVLD